MAKATIYDGDSGTRINLAIDKDKALAALELVNSKWGRITYTLPKEKVRKLAQWIVKATEED